MKDFYGNEYVRASWWRPYAAWFGYANTRAVAVAKWLLNVATALQTIYGAGAEVVWRNNQTSHWTADTTWANIRIKAIGGDRWVSLTESYYDLLTTQGINPCIWVASALAQYKWEEDHGVKPAPEQTPE